MSNQISLLNPGTLLLHRYSIQTLQIQDAISQFFWALDTRFDNIKVLIRAIKHCWHKEFVTELFSQATQISAILGHQSPYIVQILNYGIHNNKIPFYILESSPNITLKALLSAQCISTERLLNLMYQISLGLASAHHGIQKEGKHHVAIHGDLKPTNILVFTDSGLGEIAKIMGFGLQDVLVGPKRTQFMGTPAYSAPEHFEGKTSPSSDIYSLGVMLFLGLTGYLPIKPTGQTLQHWHHAHRHDVVPNIHDVAPNVLIPKALQNLLMFCLAKDPQARPQGMEVAAILKDCLLELEPQPDTLRHQDRSYPQIFSLPQQVHRLPQKMAVNASS